MSDELRAALGRLRPEERQVLAVRWAENGQKWAETSPQLGRVWVVLADLVADVDRMERVRAAGLAGAVDERPVIRPEGRGRR
ncbi:hypothetical protein E1287_14205 [Actinomadura sp. KC06]|uniref:hypothetical protein n=1 Tax=Actinomadura sp. KC06 TaxID=2530369 RepID=UPI00105343F2|nr:hypothetical protein [Actinomadura sp. KC06]TDD35260.1 hypothetical protein E1287_14205 [Actinomadura sp. KC06]